MTNSINGVPGQAIAIVGMAGRFPQAKTLEAYWQNLCEGREGVTFFSDEGLLAAGVSPETLAHPHYVKAGVVLEEIEMFDAGFFGFTPREAEVLDPQQRFFLECAWEALEHAGADPETYSGAIGVFAGTSANGYLLHNLYPNRHLLESLGAYQVMLLSDKDYLATRASYKLNLSGPSLTVQTACSTSLVAVHVACQSLLNGECDLALAGGVSITVPQGAGYFYQMGGIASPDGHCRAFDAQAQGTVDGSGVGVVILKRFEDALTDGNSIHALILGSAINNDGASKIGYTAPSVEGQAKVITEAMAVAGVAPETITYIEAHGTGTPLGDPVEVAALTQAFRVQTPAKQFCALGSVKTNIGHLDVASGVAGLIKAVLALEHQRLPPSLHFERPNPNIDFENSPFYVNTKLAAWNPKDHPRRAGVSSFGIGGTNAHVVIEEAPTREPSGESRPWQLLRLSAKTASALENATTNLVRHLQQHPQLNLADVAHTLHVGRQAFSHRRVVVAQDVTEAIQALEARDPERVLTRAHTGGQPPVVFMFPGQGTQYVNMGRDLYETEKTFREQMDHCADILKPHLGLDLRAVLYPGEAAAEAALTQLDQTKLAQPALFVIEYALAKVWMEWGIQPQAMIGHSLGEYVAACLANVFSLEDALALVAARGQLMQSLPGGAMLAISLSPPEVQARLNPSLSLAAINAPGLCVVSGSEEAMGELETELMGRGVGCRRLHTSHAFHSSLMDPILEEFTARVRQVNLKSPQRRYVSNLTGAWITEAEATDPTYWTRHLRQTIRFAEGLDLILKEPECLLLEVGPGRTLSTLARQQAGWSGKSFVLTSLRHPQDQQSDGAFLLNSLGKLWLAGVKVDGAAFYAPERRQLLPLPTYPFERRRYWVEAPGTPRPSGNGHATSTDHNESEFKETPAPTLSVYPRPNLLNPYVAPRMELEHSLTALWQELLGIEPVGIYDNFFELGGHSLMATQLMARLRETFPVELPLGELFENPTIAYLAEMIEKKLIEKIESMSEEEARQWVSS